MKIPVVYILLFIFIGCDTDEEIMVDADLRKLEEVNNAFETDPPNNSLVSKNLKILSLGDSYTIGTGVCSTCSYPAQLKSELLLNSENDTDVSLEIIAKNGWTTGDLIKGIEQKELVNNYDIVTLLIGVNNQYQGLNFTVFKEEFKGLIEKAKLLVNNEKKKIVVLSIPDYAFTPFGNQSELVSKSIDTYNLFINQYCVEKEISFLDITDISREGIENPELIASDNLHLSTLAYSKFVERLLPIVLSKLPRE